VKRLGGEMENKRQNAKNKGTGKPETGGRGGGETVRGENKIEDHEWTAML